jgi:hypothetical protein
MKHTPKPRKTVSKRPLGFLKGEIWMASDFSAPLEFIESSELLALRIESSKTAKKTIKKSRSDMKRSSKH